MRAAQPPGVRFVKVRGCSIAVARGVRALGRHASRIRTVVRSLRVPAPWSLVLKLTLRMFLAGCGAPSQSPGPLDLVIAGDNTLRVGGQVLRLGEPLQRWKDVLGDPRPEFHDWPRWGISFHLQGAAGGRAAVEEFIYSAVIDFDARSGSWVPSAPDGSWLSLDQRPSRRVFVGSLELSEARRYNDRFYWTSQCILWRVRKRFQPDYQCETREAILYLYTGRNGAPASLLFALGYEPATALEARLTPLPPRPPSPPKPGPYVDPYLPKIEAPIMEP